MLRRLSDAMNFSAAGAELRAFLGGIPGGGGAEILELPQRLEGCRLRKQFEQLYVDEGDES